MPLHLCPDCEGKGTKDNLGAFTSEDLDRDFGNGDERYEFIENYKAGMYDKLCSFCGGEKVVDDKRLAEWADEVEHRREVEAELGMQA